MYYGERFNSITHTVGAGLAAAGGRVLITVAAHGGDPWKITSFSIYAGMLLALYLTSSLYRAVRGPAKDALRKMDHCAIYLLIAGTYTPFALVTLRGVWAGGCSVSCGCWRCWALPRKSRIRKARVAFPLSFP